jgi:hypothetical protein
MGPPPRPRVSADIGYRLDFVRGQQVEKLVK